MKILVLIIGTFFSLNAITDGHMDSKKNKKEKFMDNPNYLMSFKECNETKEGIAGLLALNESIWKEIEVNPENEDKWLEVSLIGDLAANYSTIYDVWCKDMINKRVKMRMMADKEKVMKKGKAKDN